MSAKDESWFRLTNLACAIHLAALEEMRVRAAVERVDAMMKRHPKCPRNPGQPIVWVDWGY